MNQSEFDWVHILHYIQGGKKYSIFEKIFQSSGKTIPLGTQLIHQEIGYL